MWTRLRFLEVVFSCSDDDEATEDNDDEATEDAEDDEDYEYYVLTEQVAKLTSENSKLTSENIYI